MLLSAATIPPDEEPEIRDGWGEKAPLQWARDILRGQPHSPEHPHPMMMGFHIS